jgi:hypothetical protein
MKNTLLVIAILTAFSTSAFAAGCPEGTVTCTVSPQTVGDTTSQANGSVSLANQSNPSSNSNASGVTIVSSPDNRSAITQSPTINSSNTGGNTSSNAIGNHSTNANNSSVGNTSATGGTGGAVSNSGNSTNHNTNSQGQGQVATGGAATGGSASSGSTSSSGGNTQNGGAQTSTQATTQANSVTVTGDTVNYQAQERNPVASAYAAPLVSSNGTCLGSGSGGAQFASFGFSLGGTKVDEGCDARYDAIALRSAGLGVAAIARLCQKPEIEKAMEAAGNRLPEKKKKPAAIAETK